jgi:hypothetical protein
METASLKEAVLRIGIVERVKPAKMGNVLRSAAVAAEPMHSALSLKSV